MQLSYGMNDYEAKTIQIDSKRELCAVLPREYENYVLLENPEYDSEYMIISYESPGAVKRFGVGIMAAGQGSGPIIAAVPYRNMSLIGFDSTLSLLDLELCSAIFSKTFDTPLVFCKCYPDSVLVLTELCIYLLSYQGETLNIYQLDDILGKFYFSQDELSFHTYSNPNKRSISLSEFGVCRLSG